MSDPTDPARILRKNELIHSMLNTATQCNLSFDEAREALFDIVREASDHDHKIEWNGFRDVTVVAWRDQKEETD